MMRALDLVDEANDSELIADPHPFAHVIQGICLPYILLAAQTIEDRGK